MDRETYGAIGAVIFWVFIMFLIASIARARAKQAENTAKGKAESADAGDAYVYRDRSERSGDSRREARREARQEARREARREWRGERQDRPEAAGQLPGPRSEPSVAHMDSRPSRRASVADDYDPFMPTVQEPDLEAPAEAAAPAEQARAAAVDEDGVIDPASLPPAAGIPLQPTANVVAFGGGSRSEFGPDDYRRPAYLRKRGMLPREILAWRSMADETESGEVVSLETALVVPRRLEDYFRRCEAHDWRYTWSVGSPSYEASVAVYEGLLAEAMGCAEKLEVFEAFKEHAFSGAAFSKPRRPTPVLAKASASGALSWTA